MTQPTDQATRLEALRFLLHELRVTTTPIMMEHATDTDFDLINERVNAILDEIEIIANVPGGLPPRLGAARRVVAWPWSPSDGSIT